MGVERMLRLHCLQQWFNLLDPAVEEALDDSRAMRQFVGIDLGREPVPDATTLCTFRHLLDAHELEKPRFARMGTYSAIQGGDGHPRHSCGCDQYQSPPLDEASHQGAGSGAASDEAGNQWSFGMKAQVGVDSRTKLIHSITATAANVHDSQALPDLLHGNETRVWGDAAYSGQRAVMQHHAPEAKSFIQATAHRPLSDVERVRNRTKSKVRAKVEPVFLVMKRIFGWAKVRYRGLAKNTNWLFVSCGLTNLSLARRRLLART